MRNSRSAGSKASAENRQRGSPAKKPSVETVPDEPMLEERADVIEWLNQVKFRKKLFGGVDERTVWRRIGELDTLYARLLEAERLRYNALLEEYKQAAARRIRALEEQQRRRGGDPGG